MSESISTLFALQDKVALVTGGSGGLGLQIARTLGEAGARVMLVSRKASDLEAASQTLRAAGIVSACSAADLSSPDGVARAAEAAMDTFGKVDILINNAGATWGAPAESHPAEAWDKVMNLNVRAMFLMCQKVGARSMIPRRQGRIINLSSILGLAGSRADRPSLAYNTSKAAVINMTRALACEWGRYNINVNAIAPGIFPSRMSNGSIAKVGAQVLAANAPLGRIGAEGDLAGATLLFASDAGRHITGQLLAVDGGVSALSAA